MSFCVIILRKDFIIFGAESRGNIFNKREIVKKPMAFYDLEQKVYYSKKLKFLIGSTGNAIYGELFFSKIIEKFINLLEDKFDSLDIINLPNLLIQYYEHVLPQISKEILGNQILFFGGIHKVEFLIGYYNSKQEQIIRFFKSPCMIKSSKLKKEPILKDNLTEKEAIKFIERYIKKYGKQKDNWKTIGGPIDIIKLDQNGINEIKLSKKHGFTYLRDFMENIILKKIPIYLINNYKFEDITKLLF
ncbi:MAG: hypothetical protein KJ949_03125 [Nanoarchaeota archaeon]|nr:hypothetical protein [Nanoarchaeota archaeon]